MSGPFEGMLSPTPRYHEVRGRAAEIARSMGAGRVAAGPSPPGGRTAGQLGDSHIGVEHAFHEIIGDRGSLPARALAGLAVLDEVEAAVLAAKNAPPRAPENAAFLPDGQELDHDLLAALTERVPTGASFGFNRLNERTWVHVWGDGVDGDASCAVLDAALRGRRRQPPPE